MTDIPILTGMIVHRITYEFLNSDARSGSKISFTPYGYIDNGNGIPNYQYEIELWSADQPNTVFKSAKEQFATNELTKNDAIYLIIKFKNKFGSPL